MSGSLPSKGLRTVSQARGENRTNIWAAGLEMRGASDEPLDGCILGARCARPQPPTSKMPFLFYRRS